MLLRLGFCFRFGFCLSSAEAARKSEAERWLKQHAMVFGRGTFSFCRIRRVKAEKQNQLQKCMLPQLGFCFILGAACARVKQHAKVKWNGSPSSMGTEAYDLIFPESTLLRILGFRVWRGT